MASGGELLEMAKQVRCEVPSNSRWNWSDEVLISESKDIVVAELVKAEKSNETLSVTPDFKAVPLANTGKPIAVKWTFAIADVIKGSKKKGQKFSIVGVEGRGKSDPLPLECEKTYDFGFSRQYLIMVGTFHPKAYQEISGFSDPWFVEVKSKAGKK